MSILEGLTNELMVALPKNQFTPVLEELGHDKLEKGQKGKDEIFKGPPNCTINWYYSCLMSSEEQKQLQMSEISFLASQPNVDNLFFLYVGKCFL